nr:sterol regulatory element binding protein [Hymenolepis microstoma]
MDLVAKNLSDEALDLVVGDNSVRKSKKLLFHPNVVLSFVGKLALPKSTIHAKLPRRPSDVDVCLIVKDLKKADYNASNDLWKRKWKADSVNTSTSLTVTFLPISELKLCYQSFESKRKLASTFDIFLADRRIVHHLPTNLGKAFYGKSRDKIPIPVTIDGNLVKAVEEALNSCLVTISGKGTTESVVIGNTSLPIEDIRENTLSVVGGLKTIRSIYLRGNGPSVPIYYDNTDANTEESKANLKVIKSQTSSTSNLQSPITETILEAAKFLPISDSELKSILRETGRSKVKRIIKRTTKKSQKKKVLGKNFPLQKITITRDVPFEAVPIPESKFRSVLSTPSFQRISNDDYNFIFVAQIIFRSAISREHLDVNYFDGLRSNLNASFRIREIIKSTTFSADGKTEQTFDSICMRMKDLLNAANSQASPPSKTQGPTSRILSLPTPKLPVEDCAIISPSIIWSNEHSLFLQDDIDLSERLNYNDVQELIDVLFGLPRRHIGTSQVKFRNLPVVNAFATTIVLRDFYPEYIHNLRERLMEAFSESRFVEQTDNQGYFSFSPSFSSLSSGVPEEDVESDSPDHNVFVVHYRGHNLYMQYAPLVAVYTCLVLYICFSVSKINMVKSKFGLAVSACFTMLASFVMTLSACVTCGLMSPALRGREFFPYLVVLIGFEKLLSVTKAVVNTPIDIPVKYRIAQGLAKEGWPMTKNLMFAFVGTAFGFLTFNSGIQEFCLIAIVSYTTDFFLQMFFFVPVLAIDIRRMELADLQNFAILSAMPMTTTDSDRLQPSGFVANNNTSGGITPHRSREIVVSQQSECPRRSMSPTLQNSSNSLGHRRVRSDATSAPFTISDKRSRNVGPQRRLRCSRRFLQYAGITVIVLAFLLFETIGNHQQSADLTTTSNYQDDSSKTPPDSPSNGTKGSASSNERDEYVLHRQIFGLRVINRHGFELRWDADSLWRHMAFSAWPAIADRYNFSLAGWRLVVFEPIHVVQLFSPESAVQAGPLVVDEEELQTAGGEGKCQADGTTTSRDEFSGTTQSVNCEDGEFDGDRTWWSHVLTFGHKEALAALGLPWGDFLVSWTARLWDTAKMAGVSFLGGGFFLTITLIGMILVHQHFSKSNPGACREPMARVRQYSIPLINRPHNIQEWVIAYSDRELYYNTTANLSIGLNTHQTRRGNLRGPGDIQTLIAVTVSGYFGGSNLMRCIRIWTADGASPVGTIDRFYPGCFEVRAAASTYRNLERRFSPIWSMKIHPPTGCIVAGCANGTIEIWDLDTLKLRQLIDLTLPNAFYDAGGAPIDNGNEPVRVGGVTVIEPSLENHYIFYFGTSNGFVGCAKWDLPMRICRPSRLDTTAGTPDPFPPVQPRPQWDVHAKWAAHPSKHAISLISLQRVFPGSLRIRPMPHSASLDMRSHMRSSYFNSGFNQRNDLAIVSGALGGTLALIQPQRLRFQRFQWDSSDINCADFLQSTVVFGQSSGRVRMLSLAAAVPLTSADLRVEVSDLCTIDSSGGEFITGSTKADENDNQKGHLSWIRIFRTSTPSSTEIFRMVTYCRAGAVSVWSINSTGECHLLRKFAANLSSFAVPAPVICVDDRIMFGDGGYLRIINPRTAKYEQSAQLTPPVLAATADPEHNHHQKRAVRQNSEEWIRGLGPLGISSSRDGNEQLICGLQDNGRNIFIIPKSSIFR